MYIHLYLKSEYTFEMCFRLSQKNKRSFGVLAVSLQAQVPWVAQKRARELASVVFRCLPMSPNVSRCLLSAFILNESVALGGGG